MRQLRHRQENRRKPDDRRLRSCFTVCFRTQPALRALRVRARTDSSARHMDSFEKLDDAIERIAKIASRERCKVRGFFTHEGRRSYDLVCRTTPRELSVVRVERIR
jgi:hypothetical protein